MNEQLQRNQRLKPFGELLHEMYEKTRSILETKSDDELLFQFLIGTIKTRANHRAGALYAAANGV